jgi:7 transmembrane receptor (Secretin family)
MQSDRTCAVSGAFIIFGGWAAVIWVFLRALSLHLQICWEMVPDQKFFYSALSFGWAIPAAGLAIALSLTGTSYRFGDVCHINHDNGLQDFWGPLLAFAAVALVLQFITIGYCIQVFVKNILDDKATTDSNSALPQYSRSFTAQTARQTYRRVKKVVQLQWKGACVVLLIIGEVIFFSVVFVSMDNGAQIRGPLIEVAAEWGVCLFESSGNKNACLPLAKPLVKPEPLVLAVLICLGVGLFLHFRLPILTKLQLSGFWLLIFLGRWSMITGWIDLIKTKLIQRHEFVSADARRLSNDPRTYEMISSSNPPNLNVKSPDRAVMSPSSIKDTTTFSPLSAEDQKADYFGKAARAYVSPVQSYSAPRPPSVSQNTEWDPRATHARGGVPAATLPGVAITKDHT